MKRHTFISYYKLILASLVLGLGSCTSEDFWDTFDRTVDGPIDFTVGVEGSPARRAFTRAVDENNQTQTPTPSENYYALQGGTQLRLKVDGMWARIEETNGLVTKQATCTAESSTTAEVNTLKYDADQTLYWDDFGIGDPENKDDQGNLNKAKGLSILAVAVDGKAEAPTIAEGEWESKEWTVVTSGEDVLSGDILVSNNFTGANAYKFADRSNPAANKLIFKHPLSKITINLTAGEGFPKTGVGATIKRFEKDPEVTLKGKDADYVLTKGTVSIANANAQSDGITKAAVVAGTTNPSDANITVTKQAVVYPGTPLGTSDEDIIAVMNADNNIYYIKAADIRKAIANSATIAAAHKVNDVVVYNTLPGYNYIINITVNKTGIRTTASVVDWNKVESGDVKPVINIDTEIGTQGTWANAPAGFTSFALWRSENIDNAYQHEASPKVNNGVLDWSETIKLYWPDHDTHYHLRGVYPIYIKDSQNQDVLTVTSHTENSTESQYVAVSNSSYSADAFPGNLMIGMPEIATGTNCINHEKDMSTAGICATEGSINLNFRYMMSQVEVNLTSTSDDTNATVNLDNAEVELVNVGTEGKILLSDRSAVVTKDGVNFTLPYTSGNNYHGVIIPQSLVNDDKSNKVQFKITVYTDSSKTKKSVYYADVAPIKVTVKDSTDEAAKAWQAGMHYVYNLNITKTQIKATASLTDWKTVEASEEVWF